MLLTVCCFGTVVKLKIIKAEDNETRSHSYSLFVLIYGRNLHLNVKNKKIYFMDTRNEIWKVIPDIARNALRAFPAMLSIFLVFDLALCRILTYLRWEGDPPDRIIGWALPHVQCASRNTSSGRGLVLKNFQLTLRKCMLVGSSRFISMYKVIRDKTEGWS